MIRVLIQGTTASRNRKIYDEGTLAYLETRRIAQPYPYPYGFIIGTNAEDGDCVDCYLITKERPIPGSIVECEPVGLLLQNEDGEVDHKVLAAMHGQAVVLGPELLQELQEFIYGVFARFPDMQVKVGPILPREAALDYLQKSSKEVGSDEY